MSSGSRAVDAPAVVVGAAEVASVAGVAGEVTGTDEAGSSSIGGSSVIRKDEVRLADAAQGQMYVCFEGPLGVHLKQEVKEKIWKDEYVEIFPCYRLKILI